MKKRLVPSLLAVLVAAALLGFASPAQAHDELVSTNPTDGVTLTTAPTEVTFTFEEAPGSPDFITVTGPDGRSVADGAYTLGTNVFTQKLEPLTVSGRYTAAYRVTADDGHVGQGEVHFTVVLPGDTASTPSTSSSESEDDSSGVSVPLVVGIGVVVVLVGLLAGVVLARRRK